MEKKPQPEGETTKGAIAILGGTGPEGVGLALRLARAGEAIIVGSRVAERARLTAERLRELVAGAHIEGYENGDAIVRAERLVLAFPFEGLASFLAAYRKQMAGKLIIDTINPLTVRRGFFSLVPVGAGSASELVQQEVPSARVVAAFKNLSAEELQDLSRPLVGDVIICGQHQEARREVAALVRKLPELRAVDAGALANARYLEAITALLLNLNRRHRARSSIRVLGL